MSLVLGKFFYNLISSKKEDLCIIEGFKKQKNSYKVEASHVTYLVIEIPVFPV